MTPPFSIPVCFSSPLRDSASNYAHRFPQTSLRVTPTTLIRCRTRATNATPMALRRAVSALAVIHFRTPRPRRAVPHMAVSRFRRGNAPAQPLPTDWGPLPAGALR